MTLQIVQISDTHISNDVPQRLNDLEQCVNVINNLPTQPDIVVHTGDISHDALAQEYHNARQQLDKLKAPYFVNQVKSLPAISLGLASLAFPDIHICFCWCCYRQNCCLCGVGGPQMFLVHQNISLEFR